MNQENLTKEVLTFLNNNHTSVKESNDIGVNYYNFVTDTIYLTTRIKENKPAKGLENANPFCGNLVTICHECIHSIQLKALHIINLVLSNISIILTVISLILMITIGKPNWLCIVALSLVLLAIACRLFLEIDAINKSTIVAEKVLEKVNVRNAEFKDIQEAKKIIKRLLPVQLIRMVLDKIIMLVIIVI